MESEIHYTPYDPEGEAYKKEVIKTRYEEDSESSWNCGSWFEYLVIVILSTILLIGVLVLTLFWVLFHRGGFSWSNADLQFNLHPTFMVAGFITCSGFSILLYRLCRCMKHIYVKLVHMLFHACTIPCVAMGFLAIYESQKLTNPQKINFYSLHSWLGLLTMGLFAVQFIVGFFSFLILQCCPNRTYSCRAAMVPMHASVGVANFMLAIITCISGLVEKERHIYNTNAQNTDTDMAVMEHFIINAIGVVLVALGIIVSFAVRRSNAPTTAKVYVSECM